MSQKRVIVTGGSGKAGVWIIKHFLEQGYDVINVDRTMPKEEICHTILADLTNFGEVVSALSPFCTGNRAPYTGVVHMAAIPRAFMVSNDEVFRINTLSTYNILEACACLNINKVVIASSESSYGICFATDFFEPQYLPVDEAHPQLPEDSYGLSKIVNEACADTFNRRTGMQVVSFRLGNILCPEDYAVVKARLDHPEDRLRVLWSYIDARDVGIACQCAIEKDGLGSVPIVLTASDTSSNIPSQDLIAKYLPELKEFKIDIKGRDTLMDNRRAKELLGWKQQHFFESQ